MSAKDFFILHGEKIAVGAVGAVCVFAMWNAFTNRDIRPDVRGVPVDADAIRATISSITDTRNRAIPPKLKPVPTYLDSTKEAFARKLTPASAMSWLSVHPDLVNIIINSRFFYIYELQAPTIDIKDVIGSLELTIGLPTETREDDERIQDGADESWKRNDVEGDSTNSAAYVGVKIDRKVGAGEWTSLEEGRLWTMEELSQPIVMPNAQASETYAFRARLVARVTGFIADDPASGDVLVHPNRYAGDSSEEGMKKLGAELLAEKPNRELIAAFLKPLPVRAADLGARERLYEGPSGVTRSDPKQMAVIEASSPIRFQLDKLEPDPENPAESKAVIALTMRVQADGKGAWLDPKTFRPRKFTHKVKDIIGGEIVAEHPIIGGNDPFNLTTEFELVSIEKDVKRILYYEIKGKARVGQPGKDLEVVIKEVNTDKMVVRNTKNKAEMTLLKLQRIQRPGVATAIIYPDLPAFVDEEAEFYKDPANFVQQQQTPEAPKQHQPDTGPLEVLRKAGATRAKTDAPYFEFADGRLVYYEPSNKIVTALWIAGREPKVQKPPADSPVGQPPVGQPPVGQPPIGMPPGAGMPPTAPRTPAKAKTPRPPGGPTGPTAPPMGPGGPPN
nr:hypothetical protein [Planctomycetota bacterium]